MRASLRLDEQEKGQRSSTVIQEVKYNKNANNRSKWNGCITLPQRMASACVGSVLTSLLVTPFDVVRIRLQQQEMLFPPGLKNADRCCRRIVFWEENNGDIMAGVRENSFCSKNSCVTESRLPNTMTGISKIAKNEGISALYRGIGLTLLMAIPSNVVYFSGYDILRTSSPLEKSHPILNPLLCGASARILAATSVAPMELIKTRLQAVPARQKNIRSFVILKMVLKNMWKDLRDKGPSSLFKGLQLTLWRDVPFSGIYWAAYESLTKWFKRTRLLSSERDDLSGSSPFNGTIFTRSFLSGSIAGITAALFTNPFDVGKTRFQVASEQDPKSFGTLSTLAKKGTTKASETLGRQPMFKFLFTIYKNEGLGALYVGIFPRCLKIAPSCAIMISTYEVSKQFFKKVDQGRSI